MSPWIWAVGLCVALAYGLLYALFQASGKTDAAAERAWDAMREKGEW